MAPTSTGTAATYYEDYLYNSQIVAPNQVLSLVAEGVFDRYPDLRVCLAELGFAWLPSLLWRFDKDWKALWRENPVGARQAVRLRAQSTCGRRQARR